MKTEKTFKASMLMITAIFLGVSFSDFYAITTYGAVIDPFTGEYVQSAAGAHNSLPSVVLALLPCLGALIGRKWAGILSACISVLNILWLTWGYPVLISAMGKMGETLSAHLTATGWTGAGMILLMTFLLILREIQRGKGQNNKEKGGAEA